MNRPFIALQLLAHGPLCLIDFVAITGWTKRQAERTLHYLTNETRQLKRIKRGYYGLNHE